MRANDEGGRLYDRSFWHRLNQQYAEAGATTILPDDWARQEAEDNAICLELPYDRDPVATRIAGHMINNHIKAWDVGKRIVYEGFCPESDATLYLLSYSYHPAYVVALRDPDQLREVEADLQGSPHCDVRVNRHCGAATGRRGAEYPVEFLPIKRGEYICVFTACHHCLLHISLGAGVEHPDYIGPAEDWFDDRKARGQ